MIRLQSRAITFNWPIIPKLPAKECIKICHLNIRGYLNHISDLKQDENICACDIICFTETHLQKSDVIHTVNQTKTTSSTEKTELQVLTREVL